MTSSFWGPVHTWALRTSFSSLSLSVTASLWARTCWKRKHTSSDQLIWRKKQYTCMYNEIRKNNYKWGIILQHKNYVQDIAKRKFTGHVRKNLQDRWCLRFCFFYFEFILQFTCRSMSSPWVWHSHLSTAQPVLQPPQSEPSCPQSVSGTPHWRLSNSVKSSGENLKQGPKKIILIF